MKHFILIGASGALLAVVLGAFGSHGLKQILDAGALQTFEIGVRYQMYHSLALLLLVALAPHFRPRTVTIAGWAFVAGTLLFSGSLYLLAIADMKFLGPITPLGGLFLMAGWMGVVAAAIQGSGND
ncbi:DUF423 domain-containing protein [Alteromonas pelagimontana]|uniref:DUF423 domain-containing protein n=1 Tax=Alteromonas pelagimontana TaxID=1858656 RepID=A0A6M4MAT5_9ALTE|nr:DUF423 domain-containing protein [Alteromonas pelagimontana]QJR79685.1 DUF423 domain-containing protein [Alteromonas pelagimontana]